MVITPTHTPLVNECRCCHKTFQSLKWQEALTRNQTGAWLVECKTPNCPLERVTATDVCYIETTNAWLK